MSTYPPVTELLASVPCADWLRRAVERLERSPDPLARVASIGVVARLWSPRDDEEGNLYLMGKIPDALKVGTDWLRELATKELNDLTTRALARARQLDSGLRRLRESADPESVELAREIIRQRDILESTWYLLDAIGAGEELRAALQRLDVEAVASLSSFPDAEVLGDNEWIREVAFCEPKSWWGEFSYYDTAHLPANPAVWRGLRPAQKPGQWAYVPRLDAILASNEARSAVSANLVDAAEKRAVAAQAVHQPQAAASACRERSSERPWDPQPLRKNLGRAFIGQADERRLLKADALEGWALAPEYRSAVVRCLTSADLAESPTQAPTRVVFEMATGSGKSPSFLPLLEAHLRSKGVASEGVDLWWKFAREGSAAWRPRRGFKRVLAVPRSSEYHFVAWVDAGLAFSRDIVVVASDDPEAFGNIQGSIHAMWVEHLAPRQAERRRYWPELQYETFPQAHGGFVRERAEQYHEHRRRIEGSLVQVYGRFHDPACKDKEIVALRDLQVDMDNVLLDAYGWRDIRLEHEWHSDRFTICHPRQELLDRLIQLNREMVAAGR